jgi:hypothetical protein
VFAINSNPIAYCTNTQGFIKFDQGISEKCIEQTFVGRKKERERKVKSHAGLFKICVEVLTIEKCVYYIQYAKDFLNGKNFNFCNCIVCIDCFIGYEKV